MESTKGGVGGDSSDFTGPGQTGEGGAAGAGALQLPSTKAAAALRAFAEGVAAEQTASLAAGVAYPIEGEAGQVVWVHPDGSRRVDISPSSEAAG